MGSMVKFNFPAHLLVYRYKDVPREWHATCLEFSAFGWGPGPQVAIEEVCKTIQGEIEETLRRGILQVATVGPDPEWLDAYRTGRHPAHDEIEIDMRGRCKVSISLGRGKPRVAIPQNIDLEPAVARDQLQPA